jgi:exodeoxyribonuclease VII small subunit
LGLNQLDPKGNFALYLGNVMTKAIKKNSTQSPESYEVALQELEQIMTSMENGQLPLAQLLASYERGAELLKYCQSQLVAVQDQIKVLEAGALKNWTAE